MPNELDPATAAKGHPDQQPKGRPTPSRKAATKAKEWRGGPKDGMLLELPSGNVARVRRTLNLITMMQGGVVPNPLAIYVQEMFDGKTKQLDTEKMEPLAREQMLTMINNECVTIFVEPKVALVPDGENPMTWEPEDPDTISIVALDYEDRSFAFAFAQGGPASLEGFLAAKQALESVEAESGVSDQAVPAHSN